MFGDYIKHVLVLTLLAGATYSLPQVKDSITGVVDVDMTSVAANSTAIVCPIGYVCVKNNDSGTLYNTYLNLSRERADRLNNQNINAIATSSDLVIVSPATNETWPKGTRHTITWKASSSIGDGVINAYLVSLNTSSTSEKSIIASTPVEKNSAEIKLKALDDINFGNYVVKIIFVPRGNGNAISANSRGIVMIAPALPPSITITSPASRIQWETDSIQQVTWTANFVKGNSKGNTDFPGIKVVPKYGIEPGNRSLDANKFNEQDRSILMGLTPEDRVGLSKLAPDALADLDPAKVMNLPGISSSGKNSLSRLSPPGFDMLQEVDVLGLGDLTQNMILKPLEMVDKADPVFHAMFGSLLGDDKPDAVKAIIYIVSSTDQETQLKKTYVEKAKSRISLKNIAPGTYRIKIVARLKNDKTISATSPLFTVIAKSSRSQRDNNNQSNTTILSPQTITPITPPANNVVDQTSSSVSGDQTNTSTSVTPNTVTNTTVTPSVIVTVLTPNGGETVTRGKDMKITWKTSGATKGALINVGLINSSGVETFLKTGIANDGSATPTVPKTIPAGNYKIHIKYINGSVTTGDNSDNFFTIN